MKYLIVIFLFVLAASPLFSQFSGGSGVAGDEYLIGSKDDIYALIDSINAELENNKFIDKHYKVIKNIRDSVRKPIPGFTGVWNGNGYKITLALDFRRSDPHDYRTEDVALFAVIGRNAKIYNVVVDGYVANDWRAAGIVSNAWHDGNIQLINNINLAKITGDCAGGVISLVSADGIIDKNLNLGRVESPDYLGGGILGVINGFATTTYLTITNSINASFVKGVKRHQPTPHFNFPSTGAILGYSRRSIFTKISNCLNTGVLVGDDIENGIVGREQEE